MPSINWFSIFTTRSAGRRAADRRTSRRSNSRKLGMEALEGRHMLSGFGLQDGGYVVESWSGEYNDLAILPGGQQLLAAGSKYSVDPNAPYDHRIAIARHNVSGSVDTSYGSGGVSAPALGASLEYGYGMALQPDGKAIVAGSAPYRPAVARFNANGSLDAGFGIGGWNTVNVQADHPYSPAQAVALQSTGKIVVAGYALSISTTSPAVVARFNSNGAVDSGQGGFGQPTTGYTLTSFGGETNVFTNLVVQPDNKIVSVGYSVNASAGDTGLLVARYTADGVLDTTFNENGYAALLPAAFTSARHYGIALQADGKIVVCGTSTEIDGSYDMLVARYNTNGSLDTTFGAGTGYVQLDIDGAASQTSETGSEVLIQPNGKILLAGTIAVGTEPTDILVARLNADGTPDSTFGAGGFKVGSLQSEMGSTALLARGLTLLDDGSMIISGYADSSTPENSGLQYRQPLLMRFLGDPIPPTKFYVVNDGSSDRTFEYGPDGAAVDNYTAAVGNTAPRGAASTIAGDKTWVVDASKTVYVYDTAGRLFGSWIAGGLAGNAIVEGIATNGTDVWIVDAKSDKVFKYAGAASRLSDSQNAASSFLLNSGNKDPKDIVTDGVYLWVVNNSTTDKVFKYTIAGSLVGSWTITSGGGSPTGITIDPTNVSDIWIVDNASDRVYQFTAAASRTSGNQSPAASFALAAGNTNPQGIADPPVMAAPPKARHIVESEYAGMRVASRPMPRAADILFANDNECFSRRERRLQRVINNVK